MQVNATAEPRRAAQQQQKEKIKAALHLQSNRLCCNQQQQQQQQQQKKSCTESERYVGWMIRRESGRVHGFGCAVCVQQLCVSAAAADFGNGAATAANGAGPADRRVNWDQLQFEVHRIAIF